MKAMNDDHGAFAEVLVFLLCSFAMDNLVVDIPNSMNFAPEETECSSCCAAGLCLNPTLCPTSLATIDFPFFPVEVSLLEDASASNIALLYSMGRVVNF